MTVEPRDWSAGGDSATSISSPASRIWGSGPHRNARITLAGFVGDGRMNIYTHPERIR